MFGLGIFGVALVFIFSLAILVKGADWMLESAERIGLSLGLSAFVVGVVIVGLGTSLPELISSLFAVAAGSTEIVAGNAIGSNIANMLLVIGIASLVGKRLSMSKSLIDLDIPLLAIATIIFTAAAYDGVVTFFESLLLVISFVIYFLYTLKHQDDTVTEVPDMDLLDDDSAEFEAARQAELQGKSKPKITAKDWTYLGLGVLGLLFGANFLIESVQEAALIFNMSAGPIALIAVAVGTSLPEVLVSVKAARKGQSDVALGNVFGSNIFNLLMVVGIPGLFTYSSGLVVDIKTVMIGLPALLLATFLFVISGISKRIHIWEGALYLVLYAFFVGKLFELF